MSNTLEFDNVFQNKLTVSQFIDYTIQVELQDNKGIYQTKFLTMAEAETLVMFLQEKINNYKNRT